MSMRPLGRGCSGHGSCSSAGEVAGAGCRAGRSTAPAKCSFAGFGAAARHSYRPRPRQAALAAPFAPEAGLAERSEQQTQPDTERKKKARWWETDAHNVELTEDMSEVEMMLGTAALSKPGPCVVHFFASDCHGCKSMHPKVNQIMERNQDVHFVKVNCSAQDAKYTLHSRYQISKLPYFMVFASGALVTEFTCNLTTVKRLRTAIQQARRVGSWAEDPEGAAQQGGSGHSAGSSPGAAA